MARHIRHQHAADLRPAAGTAAHPRTAAAGADSVRRGGGDDSARRGLPAAAHRLDVFSTAQGGRKGGAGRQADGRCTAVGRRGDCTPAGDDRALDRVNPPASGKRRGAGGRSASCVTGGHVAIDF